jgi:hypothetical protein
MYLKQFSKNDVLINRVKTHPSYKFYISNDGTFFLKNRVNDSETFGTNQIGVNDFNLFPLIAGCLLPHSFDFSCADNSYNVGLI